MDLFGKIDAALQPLKIMKKAIFLLPSATLLIIAMTAHGQMPSMRSMAGQNMNMGHFYGKVLEKATNRPVEGATVQLFQTRTDSVLKKKKEYIAATLLSDRKGEFSLENLSVMTPYRIRITYIGLRPFENKIGFDMNFSGGKPGDFSGMLNKVDKDLGNILLEADTLQMQNVIVAGTKPLLTLSGDRKVYNVEKDISAVNGTALDVMRNVPTVNVDVDGNVSMRNASPQIFVDGRPTTLSLDQIPASQIASVEIISNPSAKYDASGGGAGILNIVLKKNRKTGYNGNYRASIDSRGRPGTGGDINLRQNKLNFSLAGMLGFRKTIVTNSSERTDYLPNDKEASIQQNNNPIGRGQFGYLRTGIDFLIDNRNTLTINGNLGRGFFKNRDTLLLDFDTTGMTPHSATRSTYTQAFYRNYGTGISFKHNFSKAGMEWTLDGNINYSENENLNDFAIDEFDGIPNPVPAQRASGSGITRYYTLQTDFSNPMKQGQKLDLGARAAIRSFSNAANNYFKDPVGEYVLIPGFGTDFRFEDRVFAAYAVYSRQVKKFNYQAGLRVESSNYEGFLLNGSRSFSNEYPLSLFPSLNLSWQLAGKKDLQFNYSRKINRPNFFQVIPFVDSSDLLNKSVGNPGLRPEFTQVGELSLNLQYGKGNNLLITGYGKFSSNLITRYQYPDNMISPGGDTQLVITYGNADRSTTIGLEITGNNKLAKWWDLTANLNLFNAVLKAGNLPGTTGNERFSWFLKLTNTVRIKGNYSIQLTADYQARNLLPSGGGGRGFGGGGMFFGGGGGFGQNQPTAQGYARPFYGMDISVKKEFMKNNAASITLQCSDIFRTRTYSTHAESDYFVQDNERLRDPQVFRLSFNWRFGKMDLSLFKRKNLKGEMDNMQNMQGIMGP